MVDSGLGCESDDVGGSRKFQLRHPNAGFAKLPSTGPVLLLRPFVNPWKDEKDVRRLVVGLGGNDLDAPLIGLRRDFHYLGTVAQGLGFESRTCRRSTPTADVLVPGDGLADVSELGDLLGREAVEDAAADFFAMERRGCHQGRHPGFGDFGQSDAAVCC